MVKHKALPDNLEQIEDGDFIDVNADDVSDLENDVDSQMRNIFSEFGGDENDTEFKINIYRLIKDRGEREFCFACQPSELPVMDRIRENFGGGRYEVWIYRNGRIFKRRNIIIAEPLTKELPEKDENNDKSLTVINTLIEKMDSLKQEPAQTFNPQSMMETMLNSMMQMQGLIKMMQPPVQQQSSINDPILLLTKGMEIASEFSGGKSEKGLYDLMGDLVQTFGKPIADAAGKMNDLPSVNPAINPVLNYPPNIQGNFTQQNNMTQNNEENDMNLSLKMQLKFLVKQAEQEGDPYIYANLIIDQLPLHTITTYINSPGAMDKIVLIEPSVKNYLPWFEELKREINNLLTETQSVSDNDATLSDTDTDHVNTTDKKIT